MNKAQVTEARDIEGEICQLGGALRGLGMAMTTIAVEEEELTLSRSHNEDMGYLVRVLGRYTERLSSDLDAVLTRAEQ